jgi:hypothetical protein
MLSKRHNIFIRAYHGKTGFILAFAIDKVKFISIVGGVYE